MNNQAAGGPFRCPFCGGHAWSALARPVCIGTRQRPHPRMAMEPVNPSQASARVEYTVTAVE